MSEPKDLSALSHLAPELARTFVSIASDIALVVDSEGVIQDVVVQSPAGFTSRPSDWVGKRWAETVTGDTRTKIEELMKEVAVGGVSRRREVNHPSSSGNSIPIAYAAVQLGAGGPVLAVGQDLRAIASIQQRFVEAQQQMERDYWQRRQQESRYRLLFQVATDAVMVVDAETFRVIDANRATAELFDFDLETIIGNSALKRVEPGSRSAVEEMLTVARTSGRPAEMRARIMGKTTYASISATPFRSDNAMLLLVRARLSSAGENSANGSAPAFAKLIERTPDAVVLTDSSGRITAANPAFVGLCGTVSEKQLQGKPLSDWLSGSDEDVRKLVDAVKSRGIASARATVKAAAGRATSVEVTATLLEDDDQEGIGFTMRRVAQSASASNGLQHHLASAIEAMMARVGDQSLPQLVQESADLFERHLVRLAIERCDGDRRRAAELLGIDAAQVDRALRSDRTQDPST